MDAPPRAFGAAHALSFDDASAPAFSVTDADSLPPDDLADHVRRFSLELRQLARTLPPDTRTHVLDELTVLELARGEVALPALAALIGKMTNTLAEAQLKTLKVMKEVQAAAESRVKLAGLQQELDVASRMQQSILPRVTPDHPNIDIGSIMIPAKEIGGDFYDYFMVDEGRMALVVADVSGKGIPAAFFMAISRTLLKARARLRAPLNETVAQVNEDLAAENEQMMFVTVFVGVLELATGAFVYVNAGHNPPVHIRARGGVEFLPPSRSMGLAVAEGIDFPAAEMRFEPGDTLVLYTDGVTEATDVDGSLFGEARLKMVLESLPRDVSVDDLPKALLKEIRAFERGAAQADDITCVTLRYLGGR